MFKSINNSGARNAFSDLLWFNFCGGSSGCSRSYSLVSNIIIEHDFFLMATSSVTILPMHYLQSIRRLFENRSIKLHDLDNLRRTQKSQTFHSAEDLSSLQRTGHSTQCAVWTRLFRVAHVHPFTVVVFKRGVRLVHIKIAPHKNAKAELQIRGRPDITLYKILESESLSAKPIITFCYKMECLEYWMSIFQTVLIINKLTK